MRVLASTVWFTKHILFLSDFDKKNCSCSRSVAKIHLGQMECFELGNLDSRRDWGHARDYVQAMWEMLQLEQVKTIES